MRLLAIVAATALVQATALAQAPIRSRSGSSSSSSSSRAVTRSTTSTSGGGGGGSYTTYSPTRSRSFGGLGNTIPAPTVPPGVRGRVQVAGSRPPAPINVQCNCGGSIFGLGYTDWGGSFYYPFYSIPYSIYRLRSCDLRFYSPGYWPLIVPFDSFLRGSRYRMSNTGRLDMAPYGDIAGTTVSLTSLMAPKEAQKAYEKAVKRFADRKYPEAIELLDAATTLHPEYAAAWTLLGQVRVSFRHYPAAIAAFRKAIAADESYVAPYPALTRLLMLRGETREVYELSGKGLELNPYDADLRYARAATALRLHDYQDAAFFAQRLIDSDEATFFPQALFILASAVKVQGDYERAVRLFGEYYAGRPASPQLKSMALREMSEARLADYTLRSMQPALP